MADGASMDDLAARIKVDIGDAEGKFHTPAPPRAERRPGFLRRHGAAAAVPEGAA